MTKILGTRLRQTWWFAGILAVLSSLLTNLVVRSAGMPSPDTLAQWVVYFLCFVGFWRCFDFLGWLAVLLIAPISESRSSAPSPVRLTTKHRLPPSAASATLLPRHDRFNWEFGLFSKIARRRAASVARHRR